MPKNISGFNPSPIGEEKPIEKEDLMPNGLKSPQDDMKNKIQIRKQWLIGGLIIYCLLK
tara:strand:- start:1639 stop:1815 length:177 start_codon:yes stop_codon:yes gene_type:complete